MANAVPPGAPIGEPFSRVYLKPQTLLRDSMKLRRRLAAAYETLKVGVQFAMAPYLQLHYGLHVPVGHMGFLFTQFFEKADIADVLDAITGVYAGWGKHHQGRANEWKSYASAALAQESMGYILDDECGVHVAVDGEFEQSRAATVAGLGKAKYAAALIAFNRAMKALDGHPPDTLTAVRGLFEANEGVFKQMFPGKAKLLGSTEIEKQLRPLVGEAYSGPAKAVANKMASSFADWVDGMHTYRHAAGMPEPAPPPFDLLL
jgi:hypothetical protein